MKIFIVLIFLAAVPFGAARADCTLSSNGETRKEATIVYNKQFDVLQVCLNNRWRALGRIRGVEATPCNEANLMPGCLRSDGTIYAGISPDGDRPMFVTRCDYGQNWNGYRCDGPRLARPWNDGSQTGHSVQTGALSLVSGAANTALLMTLDSNTELEGDQPFVAAQSCADLDMHGRSDWYLPALDEMWVIQHDFMDIGNFTIGAAGYYVSTQGTISGARWINMSGSSGNNSRHGMRYVRCARKD